MASFGAGICRESVFSERCAPRVAVYLQNRASALTSLTVNGRPKDPSPVTEEWCQARQQLPVERWLNGLGIEKPREVADACQKRGFDRLEFLVS